MVKQLNRDKFSEKAKDRNHSGGAKEKAAKYYVNNEEVLRGKARNQYRNLSEEQKEVKRVCGRDRYQNIKDSKRIFSLYSIRMSSTFGDKNVNKSTFNKNENPIDINNAHINKIIISKKESYGKKV